MNFYLAVQRNIFFVENWLCGLLLTRSFTLTPVYSRNMAIQIYFEFEKSFAMIAFVHFLLGTLAVNSLHVIGSSACTHKCLHAQVTLDNARRCWTPGISCFGFRTPPSFSSFLAIWLTSARLSWQNIHEWSAFKQHWSFWPTNHLINVCLILVVGIIVKRLRFDILHVVVVILKLYPY